MPWKLVEFIWRRKHDGNLWQAFVTALNEVSFDTTPGPSNSSNNDEEDDDSNTSTGPVPQFTQNEFLKLNSTFMSVFFYFAINNNMLARSMIHRFLNFTHYRIG